MRFFRKKERISTEKLARKLALAFSDEIERDFKDRATLSWMWDVLPNVDPKIAINEWVIVHLFLRTLAFRNHSQRAEAVQALLAYFYGFAWRDLIQRGLLQSESDDEDLLPQRFEHYCEAMRGSKDPKFQVMRIAEAFFRLCGRVDMVAVTTATVSFFHVLRAERELITNLERDLVIEHQSTSMPENAKMRRSKKPIFTAVRGFLLKPWKSNKNSASRKAITEDLAKAAELCSRAAEQGIASEQCKLGACYFHGDGFVQDYAQAVSWFRKAAEQGSAGAQCNLGNCYARGHGVPQDNGEAFNWFRQAAEQGLAEAQFSLGVFYTNGLGVPQDYAEAVKWCHKAAEQGLAEAQFALGECYANGIGVTQNDIEAYKWVSLAAARGENDAVKLGDRIAMRMSADVIAEAQRRAAAFRAKREVAGTRLPPQPSKRQQS